MSRYPKYAEVENIKYPINTDFRIALKCNEIAESDISEEERSLAIIYLLFGDKGLHNSIHWNDLLKIAIKYLSCGKEVNKRENEVDMSYIEDIGYIETSFFYDYQIDLKSTKMHWWEFYEKLCGLSEKCILNRVRYVRNFDVSDIKDEKTKKEWIKQKELVALKTKKKIKKTEREKQLDELFRKQILKGKR